MHRRFNRWHLRFDQPDPSDASYDLTNPQSFNRYAYTNNDPVNFTDPEGLMPIIPNALTSWASYSEGFWGTDLSYRGGSRRVWEFGDDKIDRYLDWRRERRPYFHESFVLDIWAGYAPSDKYIKDFYKEYRTDIDRCARLGSVDIVSAAR